LPFALDPDVPAWLSHPLWRPDLDPEAIVVTDAPAGFSGCLELDPKDLPVSVLGMDRDSAVYIPASGTSDSLRIWFAGRSPPARLAVMLPMDPDLEVRLHSLRRMHRWLTHREAGPAMRRQQISAFHRHRFILMLRILDGLRDGASRREIASVIFGRDVRSISAVDWQNTSARRHLARLIAEGRDYVSGGYRRILRGGPTKGQVFHSAAHERSSSA
jgi:hypothetical protein